MLNALLPHTHLNNCFFSLSADSPMADGSDLCEHRVHGVHEKFQIRTTLKIWSRLG